MDIKSCFLKKRKRLKLKIVSPFFKCQVINFLTPFSVNCFNSFLYFLSENKTSYLRSLCFSSIYYISTLLDWSLVSPFFLIFIFLSHCYWSPFMFLCGICNYWTNKKYRAELVTFHKSQLLKKSTDSVRQPHWYVGLLLKTIDDKNTKKEFFFRLQRSQRWFKFYSLFGWFTSHHVKWQGKV